MQGGFKTKYDSLVSRCEPLQIEMCKGQPYNTTHLPNLMGSERQSLANMELVTYTPLINLNCSPDLLPFLCSLYAPACISMKNSIQMLPPCRHICKSVAKGCRKILKRYGFMWPRNMRCKRFPKKKENGLCIDWKSQGNRKAKKEGKKTRNNRKKSKKRNKKASAGPKQKQKKRRTKKKGRKDRNRRKHSQKNKE